MSLSSGTYFALDGEPMGSPGRAPPAAQDPAPWHLAPSAILMIVVGALMLRNRSRKGNSSIRLSRENLPRLLGLGLMTGTLSGFFGIGAGFLIVPALMLATGMPILNAFGIARLGAAFGLTTAISYVWSRLVDVAGGLLGGLLGARSQRRSPQKRCADDGLRGASASSPLVPRPCFAMLLSAHGLRGYIRIASVENRITKGRKQ